MNSLREAEGKRMRSRSKQPVEKWSHSNNRKGWMLNKMWMWKVMLMLKKECSFGSFWCHLSKMHCSPALNKSKEKHNKMEEDR